MRSHRGRSPARRVQEGEAGAVGRLLWAVEDRGVERVTEGVGVEVVDAAVADDRRAGHAVHDALDGGPHALLCRPAAAWRDRVHGAGEIVQVRTFGVVELQRVGQCVEHTVGHAAGVPALQALVVLDADAGQRCDLLAAQALHAARAVAGQPDLLGSDLRPAGGEELGDVLRGVHDIEGTPIAGARGALSVPLSRGPTGSRRCRGPHRIRWA